MSTDTRRPQRAVASIALITAAACVATGCSQLPQPSGIDAPAAPQPAAAADAPAPAAASGSGRLQIVQWPLLRIDRRDFRAAPGARIVSRNNLTVTPSQVPAGSRVSYELDAAGQVRLLRLLDGPGSDAVSAPRGPARDAR